MYSSTLFSVLAIAGFAYGHGMVQKVTINGKSYPGSAGPGADESNSPVRKVSVGNPVTDFSSMDFACGHDAVGAFAAKTAPVNAGDNVDLQWQGETGIPWFHNVGPVMTYMTPCDNNDCSSFKPSKDTNWFKIDERGYESAPHKQANLASGGTWYQATANSPTNAPLSVTIPKDLASGEYLLRHEILALQAALEPAIGPEFYPNCVQLKVSGGGSKKASAISATANFPGTYKKSDAGITIDVYTPTGKKYPFPGPAVADFANSSNDSGSDDTPASSSSEAPTPSSPANAGSDPNAPSSSSSSSSAAAQETGSGNGKKKSSCKRSLKQAKRASVTMHKKRRMHVAH